MEQWYTLHTKPNSEYHVAAVLQEIGVRTFVPSIEVPTARHRKKRKPFFPGYIFIKYDFSADGFSRLRWTPGVRYVIAVDGVPIPLPEVVIAAIRQKADGFSADVAAKSPALKPGDTVKITDGPFQDMFGVVSAASSAAHRVQVLLNVLGRVNKVHMDVDRVEKIATVDQSKPKRPRRTRGRGRRIKRRLAV